LNPLLTDIGHDPIPDAYHKKIYRNEFQEQTQTIEPEPVQHAQRQNQTDMNDKEKTQRQVSKVIAIACNQLGKKKQAEVADNQHVGQPRQIIPVSHIIHFEIALQMLFDFFEHYRLRSSFWQATLRRNRLAFRVLFISEAPRGKPRGIFSFPPP
jgi:hypothetical protein